MTDEPSIPAVSPGDIMRVVRAHRDAEQALRDLLASIRNLVLALGAMGVRPPFTTLRLRDGWRVALSYSHTRDIVTDASVRLESPYNAWEGTLGERLRAAAEAPRAILDALLAAAPEEDIARARAVVRAIRDALASEEVQAELAVSALGRDAR
jgi:hypothetical protein